MWDFILRATGSHGKEFNRGMKWSDVPFRKVTLVPDTKDQLEKASLDVGRLEKRPFHHCQQKMISSDPEKQNGERSRRWR